MPKKMENSLTFTFRGELCFIYIRFKNSFQFLKEFVAICINVLLILFLQSKKIITDFFKENYIWSLKVLSYIYIFIILFSLGFIHLSDDFIFEVR